MNKFEVSNMDLYYGNFHALKNVNISIRKKRSPPSSALPAAANPLSSRASTAMNDLVEGCRISGDIKLDGVDI